MCDRCRHEARERYAFTGLTPQRDPLRLLRLADEWDETLRRLAPDDGAPSRVDAPLRGKLGGRQRRARAKQRQRRSEA